MTYVRATGRGPLGSEELEFLVDRNAMYTLLPNDVWRRIGLEPERVQRFTIP